MRVKQLSERRRRRTLREMRRTGHKPRGPLRDQLGGRQRQHSIRDAGNVRAGRRINEQASAPLARRLTTPARNTQAGNQVGGKIRVRGHERDKRPVVAHPGRDKSLAVT